MSFSNDLIEANWNHSTTSGLLMATCLLLYLAWHWNRELLYPGFPEAVVDEKKIWLRKKKFLTNASDIIYRTLEQLKSPFQVLTPMGTKIILPNRYADEIRNHPDLSITSHAENDFFSNLRGFESITPPGHGGKVFLDTVRIKLTQSLTQITGDLCDEVTDTLRIKFGDNKEWTAVTAKPEFLWIVARASSRVFLGQDISRNDTWIQLFIEFAVDIFHAVSVLRFWPSLLRPIMNEFLPECRRLRKRCDDARALLTPEIEKRRQRNKELLDAGKPIPKTVDAITWMDETAKGLQYDPVVLQLALSGAAIHTTSDLLTHAMFDLCAYPETMEPLRMEIRTVLKTDGWSKAALYKMKLLDSFLKEVQRLNPVTIVQMQRKALKKVTLSDGTVIPRGASLAVSMTDAMMNPAVYPEPTKFNAYRFLDMRQQPKQENSWQFVSTNPKHMGFGHGVHACPGRFFASNEIKIILCHMLLMYDWKFPKGQGRPKTLTHNVENAADPTAGIMFRRTEESLLY